MDTQERRVWAEIDLRNLDYNYHALRSALPEGCRMLCPVKADAYGHGAIPVSRRLEGLGADYLAVASLEEGVELREGGVKTPILILGWTDPRWAGELIRWGLTQSVSDEETAAAISREAEREGKPITVHLAVDTGMTRLGIRCGEKELPSAVQEVTRLFTLPMLKWEGIFTHFADADGDEAYTMLQFTRFLELLDALKEKGMEFQLRHCAASAAVLNYPCTCLDMVRPGICLYGHWPAPSCEGLLEGGLKPVMTLKTRVVSVKDVPAGTPVSYGCTHILDRDSRLAVLSIGYGDGLPRRCSDKLKVWLGGQKVSVVGRICMDLCMVDVTDVPGVRPGDEAEVYGPHVPVEDAARLAGTIQYELLCDVNKRVPRICIDG